MRRPRPARPASRRQRRSPSATDYSALEPRQLLFGDFDFALQFGDQISGMDSDSAGNIYLGGTFNGTADFDPGPATYNMTSLGSDDDSFVVKLNALGSFVWARQLDAVGLDDLEIDPNDNLYLAGSFLGTNDFDPGAGTLNLTSNGSYDAWVSHWNTSGEMVWTRQVGGTSIDWLNSLAVDLLGNVHGAGRLSSTTIDLDPGAGTALHTNAGGNDVMVLRLDPAGNHLWSDTMGGTGDETIREIEVDRFGAIHLTGYFDGTTDLDPSGGVREFISASIDAAFLAKWDVNGNLEWGFALIGSLGSVRSNGLALGPTGDIYVCGELSSLSTDFDPGIGVVSRGTNSGLDPWLASYDAQGNLRWVRVYAGGDHQYGQTVAVDNDGNVVFGGVFQNTVDFDHGAGTSNLTSTYLAAFVAVLSEDGDFRWAQGTSSSGYPNSVDIIYGMNILTDSSHNVFLTGKFEGTIDFAPGSRVRNLTSNGTSDGFLVKLTNDLLVGVPLTGAADYVLRKNGDLIEVYDDALNIVVDSRILAEIEGIEVRGVNGFVDKLKVDFKSGGAFGFRNGIRFQAGTGAGDVFNLVGSTNESFNYRPAATANGETMLTDARGEIRMTGVESIGVIDLARLTVTTQNSQDLLTVAAVSGIGGTAATGISGTSGGVAIVPLSWVYVPSVLVDTGRRDLIGPQANDTITVNAGALRANELRDLEFSLGRGADIVYTNDADLGLPETGGQFIVRGGAGIDRVSVTGNADWWINDLRVTSSSGGQINFDGVDRATVIAGAGNNTITAVGFFGQMILQGLDGSDTIWGGSYADTIYGGNGTDNLYGMDGDDSLDGGANVDRIFGGNGNDTLNGGADNDWLFGGDGDDTLLGGLGIDILNGQTGNDTLNGEGGVDLYWFEGTNNAEVLHLQFVDATNARHIRRPRGLSVELERDTITMDATDQFFMQALDGDDLITIDLGFANLGSVDGGNGVDACTSPASWTKTSCP